MSRPISVVRLGILTCTLAALSPSLLFATDVRDGSPPKPAPAPATSLGHSGADLVRIDVATPATSPETEEIPRSAGGVNVVTLEIVMPADAPFPGDAGCNSSYPQLCVPVGAADLDCEGMGVAGFVVLPPDVHRLDEDGDGLGCEDGRSPLLRS